MNGMDRHLRGLLEAAVGEPPRRVTAQAVHRRVIRRRVVEAAAAAVAVAAIAVIVPVSVGALGRAHGPPNTGPAVARMFTSRHYGFTEALPAGWSSNRPATQQWNGKGSPGDGDSTVDLFHGPGGVEAWVYAAPTKKSLTAYTAWTSRVADRVHGCPPWKTNQAITVGGAPARLLMGNCGSGFLVELAITVYNGTGFVFGSQHPPGTPANHRADRAAFRKFLAGIRLPP